MLDKIYFELAENNRINVCHKDRKSSIDYFYNRSITIENPDDPDGDKIVINHIDYIEYFKMKAVEEFKNSEDYKNEIMLAELSAVNNFKINLEYASKLIHGITNGK